MKNAFPLINRMKDYYLIQLPTYYHRIDENSLPIKTKEKILKTIKKITKYTK